MKNFLKLSSKILLLAAIVVVVIYRDRAYFKAKRLGWVNREIPVSSISDSAIIFVVAGQSTAANSGSERFSAKNNVFNFWNGKLYSASDPLMGADGNGGTPWCLLGDMLIDSGLTRQVVIIPIAQSETSVKDWADGKCSLVLITTLNKLKSTNLKPKFFIWQQGESDVGRSSGYGAQLIKIIDTMRAYFNVPVFVSITSYNHITGSDTCLRKVQRGIIDSLPYVLRGPDTDSIGHRYDKQHFSGAGLKILAQSWFKQISYAQEVSN